jgi:hypothetical protein
MRLTPSFPIAFYSITNRRDMNALAKEAITCCDG